MTFYSDSNVSTKYLDPKIFTPNARCTFDLDQSEAAYLPNLRLTFIGAVSDANIAYNDLVGALALIKNIRLMDGKTVLCSMHEAQFYTGFKNVNKPNEVNQSSASYQDCSGLGFTVNGSTNAIERMASQFKANTATGTTDSATLDLRHLLPMLNSVSHLPTAVFQNLNIQIEFDAVAGNQVLNGDANTISTLRPVLACDVINNPVVVANLNKGLKNATWLEVEHDFFIIPQSANDGGPDDQLLEQSTNVQINGFNNKHLERILIVKEIGDAALEQSGGSTSGFGKFSSQCCYKQKLQFRVNGRNVLPRNGIVGNNERLAHIVDAFGECSAYISSNQYGMNASLELADGRKLMGQLDYMGMYIGEDISNLQINYSRTGLEDNTAKRPTTQTLNAHVYGEVRKSLIVGGPGQGYVIRYM
jgi:hypothetical protein